MNFGLRVPVEKFLFKFEDGVLFLICLLTSGKKSIVLPAALAVAIYSVFI